MDIHRINPECAMAILPNGDLRIVDDTGQVTQIHLAAVLRMHQLIDDNHVKLVRQAAENGTIMGMLGIIMQMAGESNGDNNAG